MLIFTPNKISLFIRRSLHRLLSSCYFIFFVFTICSTSVFGEGSKELIANGGSRATLASTTASSEGNYFPTEGLVRVYVNAGETIYLGSSDTHIVLISPTGKFYETDDNTIGRITNTTEETNGPSYLNDGNNGKYYAYTRTSTETGIWSVFFMDDSDYFDVSVSALANATNSADFIKGRAYMNVFSGDLGGYNQTFNGIFYVLTNDGYTYKVDPNGLAGYRFTFFSNNKGYQNTGGTASYQSKSNTSTADLHDPRLPDNVATSDVTHKLFFNPPSVPVNAAVPIWLLNDFTDGVDDNGTNGGNASGGTLSTTWLQATPTLPIINNFTFIGNEGTSNQAGTTPLGGIIGFDSNQGGTYTITIDVPGPNNVTLTGTAVAGTNLIPWDGKDSAGNRVQGTIGTSAITIGLKAGEVHFPYIDVENNWRGIKITRLGAGVGNTTVYWDDTPITGGTSDLDGADSQNGAHTWGSSSYNSNAFGDGKGLDTWAYLLSSALSPTLPISLREADLEVVSLTSDKAAYCIGDVVTYTLKIKNNGPDAVTGAQVGVVFPSEITPIGVGTPVTTGTVTVSGITAAGATVDMSNGATLTVTITGTVNAMPAGGNSTAKASILRPADVTDPDATNSDNLPPTDPDVECNSGTVGCNNIKTLSVAVQVSDISIAATSASKSEGNNAGNLTDMTFTVSLSAPNNGCPVTVGYAIQHGTSTANDFDFTSNPASGILTFATGETSKVLTFKVRQDLMVEGNETFSVVLSSPNSGGQITTASAPGTIGNDDAITQIAITRVDGSEGGTNGSFTFTFPGGASFDVDTPVPYVLSGTAAGSGTDYTAAGTFGTITIPAEWNSVTLNLTVNDDGLTEGNETVIITPGTIGNTYNSSVSVITPVPVLTIVDNDPATLTISSPSITEGDNGTQDLTFNVTLSNATKSSFDISYATANGTALAGEDYVAKSGTLTFTGPAETQTITIQVNGDQKIEQNETFTIALSGLTKTFGGQLTVVGSAATGTIIDNDNTVTNRAITITTTNGQELGPVSGVFTFSFLTGVSADQPTTINFGLTGAAGAADYTGSATTSVTIPANTNNVTLSLPVLADDILEGPESVILSTSTVTNSSYTMTVDNSPQTLNILDDDFANIITGNVSVPEGNNGQTDMVFNVQLDKATGSSFTIPYTITAGTAVAGDDYTTQSGLFSGTLTFSGAAETQQITVKVNGDQKIEANETLILTLGTPSNTFGGFLSVNFSPATGTITDDDDNGPNKIITITKANGYEGIVGSEASFTFSLPTGVTADSDTEISYTLTGTATGGAVDYTGAPSGTIRILAGQNSATLGLPVVDDVMLEGDETVIVTVNGVSNPAYDPFTVSNSGLSLDIIENDNTVLLSSPAIVDEGNTGTKTIRFEVSVALATSADFTVNYHTTDGTGLAGEDYVAQSGSIPFLANSPGQVRYIDITVNGDLKIENNETFTVTLDGLSNNFGNTLFLSPPVTMTITDDDNIPVNKIISIDKVDGAEPGIDGTFTLSFPTGITADAATTVNYVLSGTAQGGGTDYTDTELSPIIIPAGQNSVTLSMVDVADDYIIEGTESVRMSITSVTNPGYSGFAGNSPVALDIIDDDNTAANNVITLTKELDGAEPGTNARFKVSFPTAPNIITASVPTTVNYVISGSAVNGVDYNALTGTVVIPAGSNSAVIDVLVINDQVIEGLEKVELTLTSATNSISSLTVGPGMVSANIADNDNNPPNNVITLTKSLDGSESGNDAQFKVSFPGGITSAVDTEVSYTVSPTGTATAGTDYTALSGTVTILAGDNSALIDVEVIDDKVIEDTETVLLALSSATNSISTLTVQPANLVGATITDDDNTVSNNTISLGSIKSASEPGTDGVFRVSYPTGISSSEPTQVTYTISGTAVNGTDYTTIPLTVTIPAYANSADINIDVVNDQIIEPTETVGLTLTLADNTTFNPTVNGTLANIDIDDDDNDPLNNRMILTAITGGFEPGTPGQFTVGFPAGYTSSEETIVNYLIGGTATSGLDYTPLTGTVIIPANSGPVPINIAVLNDNIIEGTETVAITLNNATNSIISSLATLPIGAVSINIEDDEDDDPADNIITMTKFDGSEPGSNPTFRVSYPSGITSSKNTQITYTVGGTAASGTDYTALSGTATIFAGDNFATIQVPVIDDHIIEPTETVELTINSANNNISALTWSPLVAVSADIADDDQANHTITLTRAAQGAEPDVPAQFKVSFPFDYTSSGTTTVTYTIGGNATAGTDYTAPTGTVTISAGSNFALINVPVLDDQIIEPTETVSLTLAGAINGNGIPMAISPNGSAVIANIVDDDNNPSNNNIYLSLVRNGIEGGDNPQFKISFPAGYSSAEETVVTYGAAGINTAILNVDYTLPLSTVTIPAYTNSALIEIPLTNDMILEPTESFQLALTGATNSIATGLTYQTSPESADIEDDDNVAANNVISLTKVTDGVEAGTPAVFNVSFPAGYVNSVATTVNYTVTGGTAIDGTDYTVSGQVIIPAGSGSANFDVTVLQDQILEATETVQLTLVEATNTIFSPITVNLAPATANILDDDSTVAANKLITITPDDGAEVTVPGVQNPANFSFRFPSGITASAPTVISYVLTGTAGGNGLDYTGAVSGTATILAGNNSVSISLPVSDDNIVENNETIILTSGAVSNSDVTGISVNNSPATLNITDNDAATLTVNNVTVMEGNSGDTEVEFTVTLDKATGGSFSLDYTTGNLSAKTTDNDYTAKSETLSFAGNAAESVKFIIHVKGDEKIEGDEVFNVNFMAPDNTFGGRLTMSVPTVTGTILNDDSGAITISSNPGSEANPNPNGASFTFSFPPGKSSDQPTTINFGLSVGSTATITDDYIFPALTGSVTIPPGANSETLTLPVVDDVILEPTETVALTVGSVVNPYGISVTTPTATTTIVDNDAASVSLSSSPTVNEAAGTATFTVTLTGNVQEAFTVNYATSNGTALAPGDYTAATAGTVSFPAGSVSGDTRDFTVAITDDNLREGGESFSVTLTGITGLTTIGGSTASTTIVDNDAASVAISAPATVNEDGVTATFTVTLTGNVQEAFTVNYATSDGTAVAPGDYTSTTMGTLSFPAGSVSGATQTFLVPVLDDNLVESGETFSATLSGITGLTTIGTASATTTITDNDAAGVALSTPATVSEATGMATFTVTLTGNVQEAFTVDYATANGTAIAPGDYAARIGIVSFDAGSLNGATKTFQVPLVDDGVAEPGETFSATLSNITGLTTIATATATTTITDIDAAGISISAPATVNETDATATFTVTLSGNVQDAFTVDFATSNGTASAPGDYLSKIGSVNFPAGSVNGAVQTFTVDLVNDNFAEPGETFSVTLSNINSSLVTMGTATASTTINDDDAASVSISTAPTVNENGTATFTLTLTGGVQDAFTVDYTTANGTAIAPDDYTQTGNTLTFPAGSLSGTTQTFVVPIVDDNLREPGETFSAGLSNITGGLATIATASATTTITDNDAASVVISAPATVNEDGVTATFTVTLTGDVKEAFTVNYATVNGTATQPDDYTQSNGSVTFPAGSLSGATQTFMVPVFNDQLAEGNETFSATLSGITGGLVMINTATATTTITDNDVASVALSTDPTVNESAGTATFTVTLSGGIQDAVTVDYATANGTATQPGDYAQTSNTVTFPAGSVNGTAISFMVPIQNDLFRESDETFSAGLSNVTGLATISTPTATTTITDDDLASVALSTPLTVNEAAGTAEFTVTLTGNVQEPFTVSYSTTNGSAEAPGDYTAVTTGTVSFTAGSLSGATRTFLVPINNDNLVETDETFSATLNSITGLTTVPAAGATATTTIVDNDVASVAISAPATVNEAAGTAEFTVTLTGAVQEAFTVNYATSNGTAVAPGDYTATSGGTVTFPAGSQSGATQTFMVPVLDDNLLESGETFSATLSGISGLTTIGTASATTTIIDNDAASVAISTPATVNEAAGTATFTVTLTGNIQEAFTVDYATANGTAQAPGDYANTIGSLSFPAGSVSGVTKSITVVIQDDQLVEPGETFSATLSNITSLTTIATATATTAITDNDATELSITDVTMIEGNGGTTDMSFTVRLNNATASPFKVSYATADGTATIADHDYEPALTGAALNFNGMTNETQTITVKIYGNKKIEANENFMVILGAVSETFGGRLTVNSTQGRATGSIVNDDSGEITMTKVNGNEQGPIAGNFIFSFPVGVTSDQPVTINYTLGGSAMSTAPDADYNGTLTGTVTIAAGDESAILNLPVNDDDIVEDDETVTIDASISSIYAGITLNVARPVVTIKDNDVAKLTLSGPVTLQETNTGTTTATFTVTLDKKTSGSFDVKYATVDGTAKSGDNDYVSNSDILHFAGNAGESYPITIQVNGDKKIEQDEIFSLVLSDLSQTFNNRLTIPVTSTTVTIENDDSGTITIVPANGSENGTPGISPASFTFRFSDPDMTTDVPVTISYGLSGTALSTGTDYDYTASPAIGSITVPANAKSVKLSLDVNDDQVVEGTETVILTTNTGALPYGITVSNSPQSLNITDNDGAKLTINNASVTEGDSGTQDITFTVKLDRATGQPFTVTYATADGTATDGVDYIGRTDVLNFNGTANEIQTITIQVKGDQKIEQNETFTIMLGTLSNLNDILSIPSPEATGTIIDNDNTRIILSKVADGEEPLTNARFKVNFENTGVTSAEATQVSYTIGGIATNGVDYTALNGVVTIPAGSNEAFIEVEVTDDQLIEPTETVILTLTAAGSDNFTLPVQATPVIANIKDNDQVALTVTNPVVTEGNNGTVTAVFNVILSTGTPNGFMVSYNTKDGTATVVDNDYTAVNGTLNFNGTAGERHSISVTIKGDQKIERDETFNMMLTLSDTFGGRLSLIGSPAMGTILDDDNIPANKKITITTTDGMEGLYNGSYTFSLPPGITTDSPTIIPFISGGTAFKNQDYIAMFSTPIIIPAGVNSLTLPVPVIDDDIMEGTETLQMITGAVNNSRYSGITVNTPVPVLNILDNDYSQLTISSPTIKEGNSGGTLITFEVKLNGATGAPFTVDYTTEDGTATLTDYDYNFVHGTLVFNGTLEGETKTISVWINGDINIEDDENFRVVLSGLSKTFGGALKISDWPGVGTIVNDDIQPVASDDIVMTDEDTPVTFGVTANDTDVDGTVNPESITVVNSTLHGALLFNPDGTFTYTPNLDYYGKDEFTYKVKDNTGIESNVAKVSIVINAVNDAPVARDDIFYVMKDGSLNATVKANDTDLDGDHLNFSVLTSPANGKITSFNPADGSFVYVPDHGFVGIDHFTYRACDAPGLCSTAQVTLYVQPIVTVKLTPSTATITEGDLLSITAEIGETLYQDVEIILNYTGSALLEKDYTLEGDYISMVIPAGQLTTTQNFRISSIKDFLKEGDETIQVRVQSASPSDFVNTGQGADVLVKDFYPEDKGTDENANGDINPDPLMSPNGDGLGNENFIIHNIERYLDNEVLIFNRWGNKVFQIKGYNNRDKAFGGVANTGLLVNKNAVLVDGVYFYIIYTKDSTGASRMNRGSVIIKR